MNEKHSEEERKIMEEFENSVDDEILLFRKKVLLDEYTSPLTVAFVSDNAAEEIHRLTGISTKGNRIVLDDNAIRHIERRHGANGIHDHSMSDEKNLGRIRYVIDNYDEITAEGKGAHGYSTAENKPAPLIRMKKRIDGTYYIVEAVSDARVKRNYIVSAYIQKRASE